MAEKIDKFLIVTLALVSAFIIINHVVFGLFGDTAFSFALLYPVWLISYMLFAMIVRGEFKDGK